MVSIFNFQFSFSITLGSRRLLAAYSTYPTTDTMFQKGYQVTPYILCINLTNFTTEIRARVFQVTSRQYTCSKNLLKSQEYQGHTMS